MKLTISTCFGVLELNTPSYSDATFQTDSAANFNLQVYGFDLENKSLKIVEQLTATIEKDVEKMLSEQKKMIDSFVDEKFLLEYDWLERAYQYRFKKPFSLDDFKASLVLKSLTLKYSYEELIELEEYRLTFLPNEKFSFGFELTLEQTDKKKFIYFDTDYNAEACLNVLRQENDSKLSYEVLCFLSFMEGCIHQGTLYSTSAEITEELIKCIKTAHQEVKFEIVRLLYNLQQGYIDALECDIQAIEYKRQKEQIEEELKYGQEVKAVFEDNYNELAKWKNEPHLKEIIEAILERISN